MGEVEFAKQVLEISENYFFKVKSKGGKVRGIKEKKEIAQSEIEQIQDIIKKQGYERMNVDYKELQKLYIEYGNGIGEVKFAQEILAYHYNQLLCHVWILLRLPWRQP